MAVEIVVANEKTVEWLAVTQFESGEVVPDGITVNYRLRKKNVITGAEAVVGNTIELQYTIGFMERGFFWAGVSAFIATDDPVNIGQVIENESEITWSNNPDTVRVPVQFCIAYLLGPHYVEGFVSK